MSGGGTKVAQGRMGCKVMSDVSAKQVEKMESELEKLLEQLEVTFFTPDIACVINLLIIFFNNINLSNFFSESGLSYFVVLSICFLLFCFVSAAGCHCFDRYTCNERFIGAKIIVSRIYDAKWQLPIKCPVD